MRDESFLREEEYPVLLLINPDRMLGFPRRMLDQENGPQFIETSKPLEAYLGLRLSPLIQKNGLADAGQHQMLMTPRGSGRTL